MLQCCSAGGIYAAIASNKRRQKKTITTTQCHIRNIAIVTYLLREGQTSDRVGVNNSEEHREATSSSYGKGCIHFSVQAESRCY